jgi:C4-dicarboxylate-specific signal transduction histidine kinase
LRNAITRLQGGKLGEKVDLISKDEIGQVGEAFNDMSTMLEQQHNALLESVQTQQKYALELEQANKNLANMNTWLEDRVQERTAELMKSNEQLIREINERILADTARKELEEKLLRSQKMEALGLLAGGVAHDLNNVLSGIVSYPDLLLMELPANSSMRKPIQTIQDSGKKAAAIVQDLLTLARRGVMQTQVLDLNEEIISDYLNSPEYNPSSSILM